MRNVWVAQKTLKENGLELVGWQDKFAVGAVSPIWSTPCMCLRNLPPHLLPFAVLRPSATSHISLLSWLWLAW